jgi:hypothetical protein
MNTATATALILQLRFSTKTLTIRGEHAITLSDEEFPDEPCRFTIEGIVADRAQLRAVRVLSEADLDEQGIPRDIQLGWQRTQ